MLDVKRNLPLTVTILNNLKEQKLPQSMQRYHQKI